MVQVASQGLLFGSGPTLSSGRQTPALVYGARWEPHAYPACVGDIGSRHLAVLRKSELEYSRADRARIFHLELTVRTDSIYGVRPNEEPRPN